MLSKARSNARRRGAAAVEFAVILPLMILLALGCIDFGRFAYNYIAVTNAARAGAAHAIMNNYTAATIETWRGNATQAARIEMQAQTGDANTMLTVVVEPFVPADGRRTVRVTASYPFEVITPWPGIPSNMTLRRSVELRQIR